MSAVSALAEPPVDPSYRSARPMGWLGETAMAIALSEAPESELQRHPAELAAAGAARVGVAEVQRRARRGRELNLATVHARDVRELAGIWQQINDLWGSSDRMMAAYDAAWQLDRRASRTA